jgi:general stress protein YciG
MRDILAPSFSMVCPLRNRILLSERNQIMSTSQTGSRARGFASMTAEKQREIARKGGRAAHERGTAHEFTKDEARAAGRKGGEAVSANRSHMATIGRLGGKSSAGRRSSAAAQPTEAPVHPQADGQTDLNQQDASAPDAATQNQQE